jgi:hypothetical protein
MITLSVIHCCIISAISKAPLREVRIMEYENGELLYLIIS